MEVNQKVVTAGRHLSILFTIEWNHTGKSNSSKGLSKVNFCVTPPVSSFCDDFGGNLRHVKTQLVFVNCINTSEIMIGSFNVIGHRRIQPS